MNVLLVSQCSKQALPATRRILDQFAERKGERSWLTPITADGLRCLHQLLRKQARRNTAVACHWIKGGQIELLWIVGNRRKFNAEGSVPTNTTGRDVVGKYQEQGWRHTESIALLASIAGLFHDFGKANKLFQAKLSASCKPGGSANNSEPIRHEWLSVRLFEAFVGQDDDSAWLRRLGEIDASTGKQLIEQVQKDGVSPHDRVSFLAKLKDRPVAWAVAWLVLSHHRLPYTDDAAYSGADGMAKWEQRLAAHWNSPQYQKGEHSAKVLKDLWSFPKGLPCDSDTWRARAAVVSKRALRHTALLGEDWRDNTFAQHIARCALMLADHYYSGHDVTTAWQAKKYKALANTRKEHPDDEVRVAHQKLDEHCIGVAHHAYLIAKSLPLLPDLLPAVSDVRALKKSAPKRFQWQNKAYGLAVQMRDQSAKQGGFIVNMASTGTGKTIANARLAYGLSNVRKGCRFSVLLGLRNLTLQTGDALRQRIGFDSAELAVLIGSSAVKTLHEEQQNNIQPSEAEQSGSASAEPYFAEHEYVVYDGELDQSRVGRWLRGQRDQKKGSVLHTVLSAPVLVSTVDRLMPATESARGGHQITPMLRLLSADTVFDEPDDFGLEDLPALCRLVHWAGLLGSRVVFSSATLSPALLEALFAAYSAGRREYNLATLGVVAAISCGWVDEFSTQHSLVAEPSEFVAQHSTFVQRRLAKLANNTERRRWAEAVPISEAGDTPTERIGHTLSEQVDRLHRCHGATSPDGAKQLSIGLVRLANIDPLVAVARWLASHTPAPDTRWHLCVYHSRHPLLRRSRIEEVLDTLLARHNPDALWQHAVVKDMLANPEPQQVVVVLATDVATTGRDHHYDWAIVEPSSVRSVVQIAGRVRRHHSEGVPSQPNVVLLQQNSRALRGDEVAFSKPGYESKARPLHSHRLPDLLVLEDYEYPSSTPCIVEPLSLLPQQRLVDLEHFATRQTLIAAELDGSDAEKSSDAFAANHWWSASIRWSYQLQRHTRFRRSQPEDIFALVAEDESDEPTFRQQPPNFREAWSAVKGRFKRVEITLHERVQPWPLFSDAELVQQLAEQHPVLEHACQRFMTISLRQGKEGSTEQWLYHPWLGVFSPVSV